MFTWATQSCKDLLFLRHIQIRLRGDICDGCLSPNSTQHNIRLCHSATCWSQEAALRDICCWDRLKNFSSNYLPFWRKAVTPDAWGGGGGDLIDAVSSFNLISTLQEMISQAVLCSRRNIKVSLERIGVLLGTRGKNKL